MLEFVIPVPLHVPPGVEACKFIAAPVEHKFGIGQMFTSQHVNDKVLHALAFICWIVPVREAVPEVPVAPQAIILPPEVT